MKMIARIREVEDGLSTEEAEQDVFIDVPPPPKTPRIVLTVEGGTIGYDKDLARGVDLQVEKGFKIAVIGANGIGKSTLLRTIAGRLPPRGGRFEPTPGVEIAYFAQDQQETLDLQDSVLNNVLRQTTLAERPARSLLGGFLFRGDDVFKKAKVLSGGELSRLGLACTLARAAGLLLLDEPTNHLDMASVESLAGGIDAYEGTVVFVSHDRTFIDAVATHVFAMLADGRSMLFEGQLADYARLAAVAGFPNVLETEPEGRDLRKAGSGGDGGGNARQSHEEAKELKRLRQKLTTRVATLDGEMGKLRDRIVAIETEMAAASVNDFAKLNKLQDEIDAKRAALEVAEGEWLEASEELERVKK
jgi:ATP-binding cassette subfamily F protein 3